MAKRRRAAAACPPCCRSSSPPSRAGRGRSAYSRARIRVVAARQDARNALATEIVRASGIRANELFTLGLPDEQPPDDRRHRSHLTGTAAESMKFAGCDGVVQAVGQGRSGPRRAVAAGSGRAGAGYATSSRRYGSSTAATATMIELRLACDLRPPRGGCRGSAVRAALEDAPSTHTGLLSTTAS